MFFVYTFIEEYLFCYYLSVMTVLKPLTVKLNT